MAAKAKKKGGSFVKQAAILAAASLLVRFLGFIYRLPLTNMIGDEGNAIYSGGYYIYTFLLILSSAGLPAAIGFRENCTEAIPKCASCLSGGIGDFHLLWHVLCSCDGTWRTPTGRYD